MCLYLCDHMILMIGL